MDGIFNIAKPAGMTSHDVVSRMRRILGMKRIGHTGTLDPMATGVLPICCGRATRIIQYLDLDFKTYRCSMALGTAFDTQDVWGRPVAEATAEALAALSEDRVRAVMAGFQGQIMQRPPMYSAVKVNGKRLYQYARSGETVEIRAREVAIPALTVERVVLGPETWQADFLVTCTKGTYIRTLCHDAGEALGVHGAVLALDRVQTGIFREKDAIRLEDLADMSPEERAAASVPAYAPLIRLGRGRTGPADAFRFVNGLPLREEAVAVEAGPDLQGVPEFLLEKGAYDRLYLLFLGDTFLGVAEKRETGYLPVKVFAQGTDLLIGERRDHIQEA